MALTTADKKWLGKNFVSRSDLKKELKNFATKSDLAASNVRLGLEFDHKFDSLKQDMVEKHDEVMTGLDAIMKEVAAGNNNLALDLS